MDREAYEIHDPQIKRILRGIAEKIGNVIPRGWGFALEVFEFGEKGAFFYISNAQRSDMVDVLQEFIDRERGKTDPPKINPNEVLAARPAFPERLKQNIDRPVQENKLEVTRPDIKMTAQVDELSAPLTDEQAKAIEERIVKQAEKQNDDPLGLDS